MHPVLVGGLVWAITAAAVVRYMAVWGRLNDAAPDRAPPLVERSLPASTVAAPQTRRKTSL
jgi:hypothetical protein